MTSDPPSRGTRLQALSWAGPWVAVASLWWWAGMGISWALFLAALGWTVGVVGGATRRGPWARAAAIVTLVGILAGFHAERQVGQVLSAWESYWDRRVDEVGELLSDELDRRQLDGEAAADALIALRSGAAGPVRGEDVSALRRRYRSAALALYDPDGTLVAWDGTHRGKVPEAVQRGQRRQSYRDLPLFGYLYLTSMGEDGSVAVAAYLLRAALPEGLGADMGDLATRFYGETGERIRITEEDPGLAEAVWDLALDEDRLLSVVLETPEPEVRADTIRKRWAVLLSVVAGVSWLLLAVGGPFSLGRAVTAASVLAVAAAFVPVGEWSVLATLFDPSSYDVPGPGTLELGRLALLAAAGFAVVGVVPRARVELPPWVVGAVVAVSYPTLLFAAHAGLSDGLLAQGRAPWVVFQFASSAVLALVVGILLSHRRSHAGSMRVLVGAVLLSCVLAGLVGLRVGVAGGASVLWSLAWGLPAAGAAWGLGALSGWRRSVVGWATAIVLGSTAAIPVAWGQRVDTRLDDAVRRLERLTAVENVELEDRLLDFARVADSLDAAGAEDVSILYEGWRLSGLAGLGYPVWLQIERRDGSPGEGLRIGVAEIEPQPYQELLAQGRRAGGAQLAQLDRDDARYILTAELSEDRMVGAVAPPFPETSGRSAMGTLLKGVRDADMEALSVLRLPEEDRAPPGGLELVRTDEGWRSQVGLRFSNGPQYVAHYTVELPGVTLAIARATLLVAANLAILLAFWLLGRALSGDVGGQRPRFPSSAISFRARVTLALFGFFALANTLFGTVAYRTLAQASHRSAEVIAERVVEDAAKIGRAHV